MPSPADPQQSASCDGACDAIDALDHDQAKALEKMEIKRLESVAANHEHLEDAFDKAETLASNDDEDGHHGHDSHEKPKSILTAFASAVINFLLMFGLCSAYGMIMFEHDWNSQHRGMAVKMNLATALLVGLLLALLSKVPVAIGGPDLNPVVFLGMFTTTLAEELAKKHDLVYPDSGSRRLLDQCDILDPASFLRRLGGSSGSSVEFCTGYHYENHADDCNKYHEQLRATTVFTVAISSAILGIIFFCLGRFKLTRLVTYVPTNIMEAFLSCVGYKVFKYALAFCNYEPKQFIPAACIGVPLYFVKALHIGNPAIVIPVMLLVPLGIFYGILFAAGSDISSARKDGWFFAEVENADFWSVWRDGLTPFSDGVSFAGNINFSAWTATLSDLPIMLIVCVLDCLLKLSSTESKLPVKADKDYEIQLYGLGNMLTTLCGSSVGYMQLKFNVINYGVMGNVADRRGGIMYALMCGACFFWTTDLFNYLPRFFLSTLLFFAGSGFVAENLWGSRKYLSLSEWLQIFFILAIFIISGSLLYAVIIGGLLAGGSFIMRYAKIPCIQGHPLKGSEVVCSQRQPPLMQCVIHHIANRCVMVIRLKGFIFFASAQKMTSWVATHFEKEVEQEIPEYRRLHWIIFDCEQFDGLDSSASKCMAKLVKAAQAVHVHIIWSGTTENFRKSLKACDTIKSEKDWFDTLDNAIQHAHNKITERIVINHNRWVEIHPLFGKAREQVYEKFNFDPFSGILSSDEQRFGCPWSYCGRLQVKAYETILWKPGKCRDLFLIHSGKIGLFKNLPDVDTSRKDIPWGAAHATYSRGWFLNRQAVLHLPSRSYGVALRDGEVLFWNEYQWARMQRERPLMANAILRAVLQQEAQDSGTLEMENLSFFGGQGSNDFFEMDEGKTAIVKPPTGLPDDDPGSSKSVTAAPTQDILQHHVQCLSIAQACEDLGLFELVEDSEEIKFSSLPCEIVEDIDIAFSTFAADSDETNADVPGHLLPASRLVEAMNYAGIYDFVLRDTGRAAFARSEFHFLCKRALLAPLSKTMAAKLETLFKAACKDDVATMDRIDMVNLVKEIFKCDIPASDIDGIANLWGTALGSRVDKDVFFVVVARFLARHMKDWLVLKGIREVMGEDAMATGSSITPHMLVKARPDITLNIAEEMVWSSQFCNSAGAQPATELNYRMVAAILRTAPSKPSPLPPQPKLSGLVKTSIDIDEFGSEEKSQWIRKAIIDFRRPLVEDAENSRQIPRPSRASDSRAMVENRKFSSMSELSTAKIPNTCAAKLWMTLDDPTNNVNVVMGIMILVSVFTLFMEPLISPKNKPVSDTEKTIWLIFEAFFTALFTLEYLLKLLTCSALGTQTRLQFIKQPMNICDVVAVLPFYIDITIDTDQEEFRLFRIARLMRLSRLVRLGRLAKRSATFAPIAMILVVIWGIYMKNGLKE